jgi:hypothetical protein
VKSAGDVAALATLPSPSTGVKIRNIPAITITTIRVDVLFIASHPSGDVHGRSPEKFRPLILTVYEHQDANFERWILWEVGVLS